MMTRQQTEITELMEKKLEEFAKHLATKDDIKELKSLIIEQNEKITAQAEEISQLKSKSAIQNETISKLNDRVAILSASVNHINKEQDRQEQYSRRYCLRISGIPKEGGKENSSMCVEKVVNVCNELNLPITSNDIDRAHRIGKEKKTMIVKFYSFHKRTSLYRARKKDNFPVKIHLDITKKRLEILDEVRTIIKDRSNVSYVFADINCNLVAKLKDESFKFFDSVEDFNRFHAINHDTDIP